MIYDKEYKLFGLKNDVNLHINEINSALSNNSSLKKNNIFKKDIKNDMYINRFISKELYETYKKLEDIYKEIFNY